jgi:hypothetical protein
VKLRVTISLLAAALFYLLGPFRSDAPTGGSAEPVAVDVPDRKVDAADSNLHRARGLLLYDTLLFTGYLVDRYPGGAVESSTPYYRGAEEGTARGWYPDGSSMFERSYVGGKREGTHRGWWPDGRLRFEYHFRNDLHQGTAREWYEDGSLFSEFNYDRGQEQGRQRTWYEDGRIRANYVVRDGRRYGLIGTKPCSGRPN